MGKKLELLKHFPKLRTQSRIKSHFERILPGLDQVEKRVRLQAEAFDPGIVGYIEYATSYSGKRIRPALALLSAHATGGVKPVHIDLAVVVELIHLASLIHDDIMDNAQIRRQQPTMCAKWGSEISVLVGDCLFAHALKLASGFPTQEESRRVADAANEVCTGEILQTQRRYDLKLSIPEYLKMIRMKTGALFRVSTELASFMNECSEEEQRLYSQYGEALGVAYQIYDDCLDLFGNEETFGKTLGTDLRRGKLTLPVLWMLEQSDPKEMQTIADAILQGNEDDHREVLKKVVNDGGHLYSVRKAKEFLSKAAWCMEQVGKNGFVETLKLLPQSLSEDLDALAG